ncbi:hypothetical protein FXO38_26381 [Capsicum annuum]|uniref:RNase H type-1 domain-containing protein n=1 Tax=Capsicum annuum TaxID=4072 RepID=A0A2G2YM90_CAPAN|nr:hypothetical protein FXO38_26381 [Capsicum annuum]KAF3678510.1 hypothetical protein FXO37_04346 [Capsicum annuum]PHT70868.1 hypothetical protein T459_25972 [Capsicum annuum]
MELLSLGEGLELVEEFSQTPTEINIDSLKVLNMLSSDNLLYNDIIDDSRTKRRSLGNLKIWNWPEVVEKMRNYTPELHYQKVVWKMSEINKLKCNTGGACSGNPGWSSISFCISNGKGELIYARSQQIGWSTNMEVESRAIEEALNYCQEKELVEITLETDSLILANMITIQWQVP